MIDYSPQLLRDPLFRAARLRVLGYAWKVVGEELKLDPDELEVLAFEDYPRWTALLRDAERNAFREIGWETLNVCRKLIRDDEVSIRMTGVNNSMKFWSGVMRHAPKDNWTDGPLGLVVEFNDEQAEMVARAFLAKRAAERGNPQGPDGPGDGSPPDGPPRGGPDGGGSSGPASSPDRQPAGSVGVAAGPREDHASVFENPLKTGAEPGPSNSHRVCFRGDRAGSVAVPAYANDVQPTVGERVSQLAPRRTVDGDGVHRETPCWDSGAVRRRVRYWGGVHGNAGRSRARNRTGNSHPRSSPAAEPYSKGMTMPLNCEQQSAVDHSAGSLVLAAGAGSGKTRVLVARYLKHLADGGAVADLVAITFTEKAAREMRQRIRETVAAKIPEADHWRRHALHLETAAINTFHGYASQLLKQHAAEAGLDPEFTIQTGGPAAAFRNETVTATLQSLLLVNTPAGQDLRELIVLFGWPKIVAAIVGFLHAPDPAAWRAFLARTPHVVATQWSAKATEFLPSFVANRAGALPAIAALAHVQAATKDGQIKLQAVLSELARFRADPVSIDSSALHETAKVGNHHTAKKLYGADNYDCVKTGYEAVRELLACGIAELAAAPANLEAAAVVSQRIVRVALEVHAAYDAAKRAAAVVDFDDLLRLTRDLLQGNETVRTTVQHGIQLLLLDELQDTDPVQMQIVELLIGDRLHRGGLFAVGDVKQSIYRFRGAEVSLFERLRTSMPTESQRQLATNFRSRPAILRFVNALCGSWFPAESPLLAHREDSEHPAVEFLWALPASEKPSAEEMRRGEAEAIAARIAEMTSGPQPRQPGEIVLLFRAMSNVSFYEDALRRQGIEYYLVGGRAYFAQQEVFDLANVLQAIENPLNGLAVVGALRSPIGGLSDDAITALCQHDDGPWAGLLAEMDDVPAAERETAHRARRNLTAWRQRKDSLPIAGLIARILADCAYDAALLYEPLGERKLANLWKLQELAREFDAAGRGLAEFASYLEELVAQPPREEQAATVPEQAMHVVRLMSIHQAKGLEFPVVFVPDLGARSRDGTSQAAVWHRELGAIVSIPADSDEDEIGYPEWPWKLGRAMEQVADEQEALRILYVAFTRAEDLLVLSSGVKAGPPIEADGTGLNAVGRVYDLTTGIADVPHAEAARVRMVPAAE